MKNINIGFLFVSIMFCSSAYGGEISSSVDCDNNALTAYEKYRSALLNSQFDPQEILAMLEVGFEKQISKGMLSKYFMLLRLGEAKISKILSYNASCSSDRILLKLKIENYNTEYSRKSLTFGIKGKRIIVIDSSNDKLGTSLHKNVTYKPIPKKFFEN